MRKFVPYSAYKDTGLKWLGEVPVSWRVVPLWTLYTRRKTANFPTETLLSVYRDHGVLPKSSRNDNFNKPSDDLSAYQLVRSGDMVINKMKAWQGSVAISRYRGIVSPAYFVYERHHDMDDRYLHYLLRSERYITGYLSLSKGIRINQWDLDPTYHSRMPVLVPTYEEQKRIVELLDRETAQIDDLIAKQERLIELLAEKRQAIITHAIAKGLDSSAPTKPSGIPWLNQVNTDWAIRTLSAAGSISLGKMIQPAAKTGSDVQAPYLRAANVQPNGVLALGDIKKMWFNERELEFLDLRRGDVVVVEGGIGGFGRAAYVQDDLPGFGYQNSINRIRPFRSVDGRFLAYLLLAARHSGFMHAYCTGVSMPHLTAEKLAAIRIPLPDLNSQTTIADHLDDKLSKLTLLSEKASSVISILQERRSALISAAVTGKIDVREGAA